MAHDHVFDQHRELSRKTRYCLDLLVDDFDLHDQMAQQLPAVRVFHRPIKRKLIDLADVVEKAAHEKQIDVDPAVVLDHFENQLEQRERML